MTKKSSKPSITKLTDILSAYDGDMSQLTAKALSNAIKKAIGEKHIAYTTMLPLTAPETKFVLDGEKKEVKIGMPITKDGKADKGFQAYGNDYVILDDDAFEEWFSSYITSLNSKSTQAKAGVTAEDIMNMTDEQREAHIMAFLGTGTSSASKPKLTNAKWTKLKKEVRNHIADGNLEEAEKAMKTYNPTGEQYKEAKSELQAELDAAREEETN
ncbi:hypothetical protein [Deinococcus aquaticus]|uniref:Phage protein n=1 Tax=Deinococcus aquaticus TaxID=328692 RepID=A0ABY7UZ40_9DEIO|nr:hypothetical protein [Deinococcus aquaticus]WDA58172.1 hypothetical protein M8445_12555 [Deinococcus aquaticus]